MMMNIQVCTIGALLAALIGTRQGGDIEGASFCKLVESSLADDWPQWRVSLRKLEGVPPDVFRNRSNELRRTNKKDRSALSALAFVSAYRGIDRESSLKRLARDVESEDSDLRLNAILGISHLFTLQHRFDALSTLVMLNTGGETFELQTSKFGELLSTDLRYVLLSLGRHPKLIRPAGDLMLHDLEGYPDSARKLSHALKLAERSSDKASARAARALRTEILENPGG